MDWNTYKALCDAPDVCSRWLLEQTLELVDQPALAARLGEDMARGPLPKPDDHEGGDETDMFQMTLSLDEVRTLRQRVERAGADGTTTSGTRDRGLGGFVETWREYEQFLEGRPGSGPR